MKKLLFILLCALMLLSLAACSGGGDAGEGQSGGETAAPVSGAPNEDASAPQGGDSRDSVVSWINSLSIGVEAK